MSALAMLQDIRKGTEDSTDILHERPEMVNQGCEARLNTIVEPLNDP
jgi:hypothetical protein